MTASMVLLTGANGYLGGKILTQLLARESVAVIATIRAASAEEFSVRAKALYAGRDASRLRVVHADLRDEDPFAFARGLPITHVIHAAADTRFTIAADIADSVNRDGSRKVFAFARELTHLQALVYLSSVYSCGLHEGDIPEAPLAQPPAFANHYERSKFEAERILLDEYGDLPWQILRTATVIADDASGRVQQINVFHNTAGLIYRGLISILPGSADTPIYFVDADPVARNCVELCLHGAPRSVRHLCYPQAACLSLQALVDTLMQAYRHDEQFAARRILPPLLTGLDEFYAVADVLDRGFTGLILKQSVESVRPFAPQLFSTKSFAVTLPDFAALDSDRYQRNLLTNTVTHLIHNVWRANRRAVNA